MNPGPDSAVLTMLLQGDYNSPWESIGTWILMIVAIGVRFWLGGMAHGERRSALYEDQGLNSGCWFNMLPGTLSHRHHTTTYISRAEDLDTHIAGLFPEGLRQVYPPVDGSNAALPFGAGRVEAAPGLLPVIGRDSPAAEVPTAAEAAFAGAESGAAARRNRYQRVQDYHGEMDERWRELLAMLELLKDPAMAEGWQSLVEGPFGLNTALEQIRELLANCRRDNISTSRLVQCEAPLETVQLVISNVRQSADPGVPEAVRRRLRAGVHEYLERDLPQLRHSLFGGEGTRDSGLGTREEGRGIREDDHRL